jgi:transposase, IS6 family
LTARRDPFRDHRVPKDAILLAMCWYCSYPLSYRDSLIMLAERGVMVDDALIHRWVRSLVLRCGNVL